MKSRKSHKLIIPDGCTFTINRVAVVPPVLNGIPTPTLSAFCVMHHRPHCTLPGFHVYKCLNDSGIKFTYGRQPIAFKPGD